MSPSYHDMSRLVMAQAQLRGFSDTRLVELALGFAAVAVVGDVVAALSTSRGLSVDLIEEIKRGIYGTPQ
jgi:hypothetical protein